MGKLVHLYSIVIPVYNRPEELKLLLDSIAIQQSEKDFEVVVVEDGSQLSSKQVCEQSPIFSKITYLEKSNSGPGLSRNYGMMRAKGDYFIILDSDCILPPNYLSEVDRELSTQYTDFFGGPDAALASFTPVQQAVNLVMTATLSTAGIRGGKPNYFEPRSFNMGLSSEMFKATGGFGAIHPGEDPDLVMRAWKLGYKSRLFSNAIVYHQRRIQFSSFFKQVFKFGSVRPILEVLHPEFKRLVFKGPSLFLIYLITVVVLCVSMLLGQTSLQFTALLCAPLVVYLGLFKLQLIYKTRSIKLTSLAILAFFIQMSGYGLGYMRSSVLLAWNRNKNIEALFPHLFFNPIKKGQ
jgi:glycosyltransferase involved in cell wall biosynthesis